MSTTRFGIAILTLILAASSALGQSAPAPRVSKADLEFFEKRVRPLLAAKCYACHSAKAKEKKKLRGGLLLDSRAGLSDGGDSGPAIVPGLPEKSRLIEAVRYANPDLQMPPKGKLSAGEVAVLEAWVKRGATFPAGSAAPGAKRTIDLAAGRKFWSFQPLRTMAIPKCRDTVWPRQRVDAFILAKLEQRRLTPSPQADRRTLIRRATFDLIGLPPTPEEVEAFVGDDSPDAYRRLIERLLASPRYGERWARYWLDLARYSDSTASWLKSTASAYLYRDWVVKALNDDVPYDRLVKLQLAADMMPGTPPADLAALGLLGLSPTYWKEPRLDKEVIKGIVADEWEERIDTVGRTFLGLTVACARCHDHKFDPITTEDYYALAGVFASTRLVDRALIPDDDAERVRRAHEQVRSLAEHLEQLKRKKPTSAEEKRATEKQIEELQTRIGLIRSSTPHFAAPRAPAVDDAALYVEADGPDKTKLVYKPGEPRDLPVFIRGNPSNLGKTVRRRFLAVLSSETPAPFQHGSGRLDLAEAIFNEGAPLAARVMVNRVWRHHFGRGLVDTPSNFGEQGARPTHPRLLDDLAARFVEHGWSLKWLHREIMLSATYQQASTYDAVKEAADPDNRLLWRMNRRRMDVEAWRDAMLAVAGQLDPRIGGVAIDLASPGNHRRTLYGRVQRRQVNDILRLYDFPDPTAHSPARDRTTTPLQQLFVLNSPLMQQQSAALGQRLAADVGEDVRLKIDRAYQLLYARPPSDSERQLALEFLQSNRDAAAVTEAWREYAQVLLGNNEFMFID